MILVNLFGAPGAGKSTGAAYVFSKLKMAGVNAELVTEFAKDKVWEESKAVFDNQAYIFGKQYFRISRCYDKVDVIVTDSPLLLSILYNHDIVLGETFNALVRRVFGSFNNLNFLLTRVKGYNPAGRFQTEQESDILALQLEGLLKQERVEYLNVPGSIEGYDQIVEDIINEINYQKENNIF